MKVNLKTTNDENAAATLVCHQKGPRTVNGIIGNTRRGIRVDQTLDPDSNNPVANKPVSTALAALAGKIDAALQKPTGLAKTELVGVGANGQENIEIGDNLTLANGKLLATGGVNGLESDAEGNLTASKNLGVDGKLTLKSLVSASNPDGDITKELGGSLPSTIKFDEAGNREVEKNLKVDGKWLSPYAYNKWYNDKSEMFTTDNRGSSVYMFSGKDYGGSPCFGPIVTYESDNSLEVTIEYSHNVSQIRTTAYLARKQYSHNILLTGESNQIVRIIALLNGIGNINNIKELKHVLSYGACLSASGNVLSSGQPMDVAYVSVQDGQLRAYDINGNSVDISNFTMTDNAKSFNKVN